MQRLVQPGLAGLFVVAVAAVLVILIPAGIASAAGSCGRASFYCCEHHGRETASGEIFNQNAMTAAMPNRSELGRVYRVTYAGRSVVVRITDVGPAKRLNRVIDLSKSSFARLAPTSRGVIRVCLERL